MWCAAPAAAAALIGCSPGSHPPSTTTPPASEDACGHAKFSRQQFTGDWTEEGDTTVVTLSADGKLKSSGSNRNESGTWNYAPWALTPGKSSMPRGEDNACVLWLHWAVPGPAMDQIYEPLKVGTTSLQLSYVGRGNTLTWTRRGMD
jgi:hypothetical protein